MDDVLLLLLLLTYPLRIMWLCYISVDPVQDVESPVKPQEKYVVSCKIVHILCSLQQNQLRQDRNRFQIYREGPQNL